MKKLAMVLALMMVMSVPAFAAHSVSGTVDTFIDNRMNSDLSPVEDAGQLLHMADEGIDKTYHVIAEPMEPILNPVRKVRDGVYHGVNMLYDTLTLKKMRE